MERAPLERMARDLPHAELIVWDGIGHAPRLEHPERFNVLLTEFIVAGTAFEIAQLQVRRMWR